MIIVDKNKNDSKKWSKYFLVLLIAVIFLYLLLPSIYKYYKSSQNSNYYFCDAEEVRNENFLGVNAQFSGGQTQSSDYAFSGKYSSKLVGAEQYGLVLHLDYPKVGSVLKMSVMYYGDLTNIYLSCNSNPESNLFYSSKHIVQNMGNGWSKVELKVTVPDDDQLKYFLIFAYNPDPSKTVYYDDLTVEIEEKDLKSSFTPDIVSLYLDNKALNKLENQRNVALNKGILITDEDSWVKGKFSYDSLNTEVELRFKGDWVDHLEGDKWSYRIKMPSEESWKRMKEFSLQSPDKRFYVKEWVFHKMLENEDILSTPYDFIRFKLNNQPPYVYAYEGHMLKQIPESNKRREGVIIKFGEDEKWSRLADARDFGQNRAPYENEERVIANIEAFKSNKIKKNPVLMEQWQHAHELLYNYQQGISTPDAIFDIDRMAKYYAICDIMEANHSTIWHNQRFYYNPIIGKLEPIGFDGYSEEGELVYYGKPFLGNYMNDDHVNYWYAYYSYLFKDRKFSELYAHYLAEFSKKEYLEDFFDKYSMEINERIELLKEDFPSYNFETERIYAKAINISQEMKPADNHSVKVYIKSCESDSCTVSVVNVHRLPLTVFGSKNKLKDEEWHPVDAFLRTTKPGKKLKYFDIKIPIGDKILMWKLDGVEGDYYSNIQKINPPAHLELEYKSNHTLQLPLADDEYSIHGDLITINSGTHEVKKPMIVTADYQITINAGAEIELADDAYILSYGAVNILGTEENPVQIIAKGSNQGFSVIKPEGECIWTHVRFDGLDRLEENQWQLTGAVTVYEANINMDNVSISHNKCEDALNLIRSDFDINHLFISNTFADGFDADFCEGKIKNSVIRDTGNDALDFSGSTIEVEDCRLIKLGDKGLSAGEQSTISGENITVDGADIGIASKDLSLVRMKKVDIKNCDKGLSAYMKKPEYGGGRLEVKELKSENIQHLFLKDDLSVIMIDNEAK
ncbi:MAG: hypothetical protein KDC16_10685 [Saprospiraceae bacterium]|nr:hypothetical protein [Saprospiraceae bacterium]MCB9327447.1 hypothetical protein [Lewinellaceae bacterium]HPK10558.1 hypothetical protein [Saprospiraceae bacterium]